MPTTHSKSAASWWQMSTKIPSGSQIDRACGDYRLVYLRTMKISSVFDLKANLRQHYLYRIAPPCAIFPFGENLWEVLVSYKSIEQFKTCVEACHVEIEDDCHPGKPVEDPSCSLNRFQSCLRARERLIARAFVAQLASKGKIGIEDQIATIYRDLVKLYRCYHAYMTIDTSQLSLDKAACSPGWSCTIGPFQYGLDYAATGGF
ncbi:MAG: hypothetical protein Q9217_002669 [Psora testacea]